MRLLQAAPHLSINSSTTSRPTFVNFGSGSRAFHLEKKGTYSAWEQHKQSCSYWSQSSSSLTHHFRAPVPPRVPPLILSPKLPKEIYIFF